MTALETCQRECSTIGNLAQRTEGDGIHGTDLQACAASCAGGCLDDWQKRRANPWPESYGLDGASLATGLASNSLRSKTAAGNLSHVIELEVLGIEDRLRADIQALSTESTFPDRQIDRGNSGDKPDY